MLSVSGYLALGQSDRDVIISADRYFRQGNYPEAMPLYSQLLSIHRNEPLYAYRFGVSMLYSDRREPDLAIRYIESALGKLQGEDAVMIYYHLATAYHLTFRFIEALRYYNMFSEVARGKQYAEYNVEQKIQMCNNGVRLLMNIRDLYVFERHHVYFENFFRSYNVTRFGGKLLVKPDIFKTRLDKRAMEQSIIFLSDTQHVVYYSSYGKDGKYGKDIYRSFKKADGSWDTPERLSNIVNTEFDEDYPFILPDGKTLYFCSKGHNSMGGYDIFRTIWDDKKKEWTPPVNLDFAINTPYDDILFVTDKEEKYAYFSSVRNSGMRQINVYLVRIDVRPDEETDPLLALITDLSADVNDTSYKRVVSIVQNISTLNVNTRKDEFEDREVQRRKQLHADNYRYNISPNPTDEELIILTFRHVADAEKLLQELRQKRKAFDLAADHFREKQLVFSNESQKLEQLAGEQNELALRQFYTAKADTLKIRADEAGQMCRQSVDIAKSIDISIDLQRKEYDKILLRAGEIQKLASAKQIDSSVVLLKKLIDDIRMHEQDIEFQLVQLLPAPENIPMYDVRINEKKNEIFSLNESQNALIAEKAQLQRGFDQAKDPVVRETLKEEMKLVDREIAGVMKQKNVLYDELEALNREKNAAEQYVRSTEYSAFQEIQTIQRFVTEHPGATLSELHVSEPALKAVIPEDYVVIPNEIQQVFAEKPVSQPVIKPESEVISDKKTDTETISDTKEQTSQVITDQTTLSNPEVAIKDTDIQKVDVQALKVEDDKKQHDIQFETQPDQIDIAEKQTKSVVQSVEEKKDIFFDMVTGDLSTDQKMREIIRITEEEKASLLIRKNKLREEILNIFNELTRTEKKISVLSAEIRKPGLDAWEKRLLERDVTEQIEKYRDDLEKLDRLILMYDYTGQRVDEIGSIAEFYSGEWEKIEKIVMSGNERKAGERFEKLSGGFPETTEILFRDAADFRFAVRKHAEAIENEAVRMETLAEKAASKSEEMTEKAIQAENRAEKTGSEAKRQKLAEQKEQYELLAIEYKDSATFYSERYVQLKEYAAQIKREESTLADVYTDKAESSSMHLQDEAVVADIPLSASEMLVMKQLILQGLFPVDPERSDGYAGIVQVVRKTSHTGIPTRIESAINPEVKKSAVTAIRENEDISDLRKTAETEHIYLLRASATLLVSKIRQLDDEIRFSTDPQAISQLSAEKSLLQEELSMVVKRHDRLAADYPDLEQLQPQTLPSYSELNNDPDVAIAAMERAISLLENELAELKEKANISSDMWERRQANIQVSEIEAEIIEYRLSMVDIIARADRNKTLVSSIIAGNIPLGAADAVTLRRIDRLTEEQMAVMKRIVEKMSKTDAVIPMEQKLNLYIDIFKDIQKDLELQSEKYQLYREFLPAGADQDAIAKRSIQAAVSDKNTSGQYLTHVPAAELLKQIDTLGVIRELNLTGVIDPEGITLRQTEFTTEPPAVIQVQEVVKPVMTDTERTTLQRETAQTEIQTRESIIVTDRQSAGFTPYYSAVNPIPEHSAPEGKLIFRVQFAASRKPAADDAYAGMSPLFYEQADGWYRYMHGEFYQPEPAVKARDQVRTMGFADAFVVAYYNGKRITMAEARGIIASTQGTPGTEVAYVATPSKTGVNIIPFSGLTGYYYAVQIGVYGSPRNSERLFGITPLIEDRMANGNFRYLTGTYASFEEATAARDKIRAAGVPDAFIVVYRNGVRISVAEARDFIAAGEKTTTTQTGIQPGIDAGITAERAKRVANISFKVQLGAFRNQVPVEVVNTFISVAGEGIQILTDTQGLTIYLAGSFKTPAEAEALRNKVQAEGIPDAFIVAVEGDKKISMQEAREVLGIR